LDRRHGGQAHRRHRVDELHPDEVANADALVLEPDRVQHHNLGEAWCETESVSGRHLNYSIERDGQHCNIPELMLALVRVAWPEAFVTANVLNSVICPPTWASSAVRRTTSAAGEI
jgi:hypothetical protein